MRTDGIHFGTGEDFESGIWPLLADDAPTLLNEPEARHHWAAAKNRHPDGLVLWRSSPDRRPADDGWDAHTFSRAVFRSIDFHHDNTGEYPTDVILLNELNLDYERGEEHNSRDKVQFHDCAFLSMCTKCVRSDRAGPGKRSTLQGGLLTPWRRRMRASGYLFCLSKKSNTSAIIVGLREILTT